MPVNASILTSEAKAIVIRLSYILQDNCNKFVLFFSDPLHQLKNEIRYYDTETFVAIT
jgi:hypothetical protein